jgi:hypothetical protein
VGTIPSIPGVTQIQYEYKGLPNGPELRTFKISGYVDGNVFHAGLHLKMVGDVDGDKNLYTGEITPAFVRLRLDTLSSVVPVSPNGVNIATAFARGANTNTPGAEKVGAKLDDIVKQSGGKLLETAPYPYGGDWVGVGWGSETQLHGVPQRIHKRSSRLDWPAT